MPKTDVFAAMGSTSKAEQAVGALRQTIDIQLEGLIDSGFDQKNVDGVRRNLAPVVNAVNGYFQGLEKAEKANTHTPKGLSGLRDKLKGRVEAEIKRFEDNTVSNLDDARSDIEGKFERFDDGSPTGWKSDNERLIGEIASLKDYMSQKEVRDSLKGVDEAQLTADYFLAVEKDDLLARAIENSPVPMIKDKEILKEGRMTRARRQMPEKAAQYDQYSTLINVYRFVTNTIRRDLGIQTDPHADLIKQASPKTIKDPVEELTGAVSG